MKAVKIKPSKDQVENKESQIIGSVGYSVYKSYFMAVDSYIFLLAVAILFIIGQSAISGVDLFVSKWYVLKYLNKTVLLTHSFFSGLIGKTVKEITY